MQAIGFFGGDTGTYTLSVIVLGANGASEADTDCPDDTTTTCEVDVGGSVTGNISTVTDVDWFKVVLEANKTYQIDMKGLEGLEGGGGTLGDPILHDIRDSSGSEISGTGNDDVDADNDIYDSQITFTPTTAGAYYLVAAGVSDSGTYTLSVREAAAVTLPTLSIADAEGDEDDGVEFTATLTAGVSGKVTATWTATIESGDTASAADLATTKTGEVEFDENATEATFTVQVNDDTTDEPDQTFTVTLSGVSSNAQLAADPTAEGTIDDDDDPPTLTVADVRQDEGVN